MSNSSRMNTNSLYPQSSTHSDNNAGNQKTVGGGRFHLLAPMSQRNGGSMSGRPISGSSARDDLSSHRYILTQPEGLAPLSEDKYSNGDRKFDKF